MAEDRASFSRILEEHVIENLYGEYLNKPKKGSSKVLPNGGDVEKGETKKSKGGEIDDYTSPLELEIYVDFRVRSIAKSLERSVPALAKQLTILEVLALLSNAVGGVLSILGYAQWVSVAVAAGIVFASLQDYYSLPAQVTASNEATAELHAMLSWWDSLSLVQRKTRDTKQKCAELAEGAILKPIGAKTGSAAKGGGCACEEGDEGGDDK